MKNLSFFTLRDFNKHGGGGLRILGIVNALSLTNVNARIFLNDSGYNKTLISNKVDRTNINVYFSQFEKRIIQFLIAFLPVFFVTFIFKKKISKLRLVLDDSSIKNQEIVFFEYLDLSIGYVLKTKGVIKGYICDIHGIGPNEFKYKKNNVFLNKMKYFAAVLLERKVFSRASGFIFASKSMQNYFHSNYPKIKHKKHIIIPYCVETDACLSEVDSALLGSIRDKFDIKENDEIIFFAGSFKYIGGITCLVKAYKQVLDTKSEAKLFLIGTGEEVEAVRDIIKSNELSSKVIHLDKIPYSQLRTYQEIASVIVCPDRDNLFSHMVLHLKYLDSLASNKIVINGMFDSVMEINNHEELSINFQPSSISSLVERIIFSLKHREVLLNRYKNNNNYVKDNFTYENAISELKKLAS